MPFRLRFHANVTNNLPENPGTQIDIAMRDAISEATRFGRELTRANTPKRTGRTASSVAASVTGGGSRVIGTFGSDSLIFLFLEEGTRPHPIDARFKKALFWPGARHPVRRVPRHPGTTAQHTLERSAQVAGVVAKERLSGVFEEVFG